MSNKKRMVNTTKKIAKIYSEISKGLKDSSMSKEMVRIKIEEANLYIKELENTDNEKFLE